MVRAISRFVRVFKLTIKASNGDTTSVTGIDCQLPEYAGDTRFAYSHLILQLEAGSISSSRRKLQLGGRHHGLRWLL
jgi:hypothetical protein